MFEGLDQRLLKEIEARAPKSTTVKVHATPNRQLAVWNGGSVITSLVSFESQWVTKEDYEEHGASIVIRKCV